MDGLLGDLRFAARTLARAPGFTLVAVATLALGIGANTAVFTVVDAVLLHPLPFEEADRLVTVSVHASAEGGAEREASGATDLDALRAQPGLFDAVGGWAAWGPTLTELGDPVVLRAAQVTAGMLEDVLGVEPFLGRGFSAEEDLPGAAGTVLLGHGFWLERFGGDRSVLGRPILLDGTPYSVVGVMPAGFAAPFAPDAEVWTAARLDRPSCGRGCSAVAVIGRLAEDVPVEVARERVSTLAARLAAADHPDTHARLDMVVAPLHEEVVGPTRPALRMLLGAVGLVLLIACTNVGALLLFRGSARRQELAIRIAMGADRGRILRQLVVEGVALALLGGLGGLAVASWASDALIHVVPLARVLGADAGVDGRVLAFTAAVVLGTGVAVGLVPGLLSGGRADATPRRRGTLRLGRSLVVGQIALATVLLVGSGLLVRSLQRLGDAELGFLPEGVLAVELALSAGDVGAPAPRAALLDEVLRRVEAVGGVRSAAAAVAAPLVEDGPEAALRVRDPTDPEPASPGAEAVVRVRPISRGYFYTVGQRIVAGREFDDSDGAETTAVAVVGEGFAARRLGYPRRDPLGVRVAVGTGPARWRSVVGVASDTRHLGPRDVEADAVYIPLAQSEAHATTLLVRADVDPLDVAADVRAAIRSADAGLAASEVATMEERARSRILRERTVTGALGVFSLLSLLLTAVGVYGVVALDVARRMRELGIRVALGADREELRRLVLRRSIGMTVLGVGIGAAGALVLGRVLGAVLYGVTPADFPTFAVSAVVLALVAVTAARPPAERAGRTSGLGVLGER